MNPEIERTVADLEKLIGSPLPPDYRRFLVAYGGDDLQDKSYWMPHPDGRWIETIDECYSVDFLLDDIMPSEIVLRRKGISDFAPGLLPIANNGCGDTVLLSYRDRDYGAVYHFFHEEGDADDRSAGLHLLAPTFTDWLNQIQNFSEDESVD